MALYTELPIYKATYDFLLEIYKGTQQNIPRDIKYTLVEELKKDVMGILILIYTANATRDKLPHLKEARHLLIQATIRLRVLHDLKVMGRRKYAHLSLKAEEVSKQLSGWTKYIKDRSASDDDSKNIMNRNG